jgi:hypothetical protein
MEVVLKDNNTLRPGRTTKTANSMVVMSSLGPPTVTSEPETAALILSLQGDCPEAVKAMTQLYEMTYRIVAPYVGLNPAAPGLEDQVEDLVTITLEAIFCGGLTKPSALPHFIETLGRQWNRTPLKTPKYSSAATSRLKRGIHIPFPLGEVL